MIVAACNSQGSLSRNQNWIVKDIIQSFGIINLTILLVQANIKQAFTGRSFSRVQEFFLEEMSLSRKVACIDLP